MKNLIIYTLGCVLIVGGLYTLYVTSSILFDIFEGRSKYGHFVPLAQVACFICSFIYIVSGILFFMKRKLATPFLFVATIIMFIGYIAMLFHIKNGLPLELQTVAEMLIRTSATMLYAGASWYIFTRTRLVYPPGYDAKSLKKLMNEYLRKEIKEGSQSA